MEQKRTLSTVKGGSRGRDSILSHPCSAICISRKSKGDGDGNGNSSYQCTEPGCNKYFKTQANLDLHMNLLDRNVSPVPANVIESLYDKVKME